MRLVETDALFDKLSKEYEICTMVEPARKDTFYMYALDVARDELTNAPTVMQWVSVEDELPQTNRRVLIVNKASDVFEGMLTSSDGELMWHRPSRINQPLHKFTHWMPLPPPPGK